MMDCGTASSVRRDVSRREIWAWAMYDFANSGYTTVVITAIFNAYFVAVVAAGVPWATFANLAGLCLGASQSAGRALVGYLAPAGRHGEFFGLWGLAVKLSSILGPLTYGTVTWLTGGDHRLAILITGAYFVVGLFILAGVDAERGRRSAMT